MAGTAVIDRKTRKKTVKKELNLDIVLRKIYRTLEKAQDRHFRVFAYDIKLRTEEELKKMRVAPEKRITKLRVLKKVMSYLTIAELRIKKALDRVKELNEKEIERMLKYAYKDTKSAFWFCMNLQMQKGDLKTNIKEAHSKMMEAMKAIKRAIKIQENILKYSKVA